MIGYLDIDINGYVYNNSSATTPVNNVCIVTSVHATPAVTAGGNKGEGRKASEGDAVTALYADPSETQLTMAQKIARTTEA
ncbi:Metal transporter Nramp2 [Hordeum vulgare]|nr:Metal transporter Nramp2 [Hordeum vulgare]